MRGPLRPLDWQPLDLDGADIDCIRNRIPGDCGAGEGCVCGTFLARWPAPLVGMEQRIGLTA
jgi:hypothetical protein